MRLWILRYTMLITIDLEHPDNDVEVVGLSEGETLEVRLGPRGYAAYRLFGAAARMLFLAMQDLRKPDIAAATEMMIEKESGFIRERLDELRRPVGGGDAPRQGTPSDRRTGAPPRGGGPNTRRPGGPPRRDGGPSNGRNGREHGSRS